MTHVKKRLISRRAITQAQTITIAVVIIIAAIGIAWYATRSSPEPEPEPNGGEPEEVELRLWAWGPETAAYTEVIRETAANFTKETGIKIKIYYQPTSTIDVRRQFMSMLAAGEPLDVGWANSHPGALKYYAEGLILPLNQWKMPNGEPAYVPGKSLFGSEERYEAYPAGSIEKLTWPGTDQVIGLPRNFGAPMLLYNKAIFAMAGLDPEHGPETWEELLEYALIIKEKTDFIPFGVPLIYDFYMSADYEDFYYSLSGKPMVDVDGNCLFNSSDGIRAAEFWFDLVKKGVTQTDPLGTIKYDLRAMFRDGKLAMHIDQGNFLKAAFEEQGFDFSSEEKCDMGLVPIPAWEKDGPRGRGYVIYDDISIFKSTKHPVEAVLWIEYVTREEVQYEWHKTFGFAYMFENTGKRTYYADYRWFWEKIRAQAVTSLPMKMNILNVDNFQDAFIPEMQKAFLGEKTIEDALNDAAKVIQLIEKELRRPIEW